MGPLHKGFLNLLQYAGCGILDFSSMQDVAYIDISFYDTRLQRGKKGAGGQESLSSFAGLERNSARNPEVY